MIQPRKWSVPLGSGADVQDLPDDDLRYASFSKIFPQITQVPLPAGGVAPRRIDFNSLFKLLADNIYFYQNGGVFEYSDTADYEKGALVRYNDNIYLCIQDNSALNVHNPEDMDYWLRVALNNELSDYLPLAGGNLTGNLTVQNKNVVRTVNDIEADVNGNVVIESGTSFLTGQLIQSIVPLNDAMLHLADGALISGSGSYAEFVTFMAGKVSTNPNLFVSEAVWQQSITNYGECGKFVYDANANTIRLPKLNGYIKATNTASEVGNLVEAGAPNITGDIVVKHNARKNLLTGMVSFKEGLPYLYGDESVASTDSGSYIGHEINTLNAHNSNPIYKDSATTIDVQAIKVFCYVVLGTVSKTDIQIDIDNVMTDLALKADKDFSNVTAPVQAFKDMSIEWGLPDYTAGINITTLPYTAPNDGYINILCNANNSTCVLQVNTTPITILDTIGGIISGLFFKVKKGDILATNSANTATVPYNNYGRNEYSMFYPCKGAN